MSNLLLKYVLITFVVYAFHSHTQYIDYMKQSLLCVLLAVKSPRNKSTLEIQLRQYFKNAKYTNFTLIYSVHVYDIYTTILYTVCFHVQYNNILVVIYE